MSITIPPGVKLVVSGYSTYRVYQDGNALGTVERMIESGRRIPRAWRYYAENGGTSEVRTRAQAIDSLIELARAQA